MLFESQPVNNQLRKCTEVTEKCKNLRQDEMISKVICNHDSEFKAGQQA